MDFVVQYWYLFLTAIVSGALLLMPTLGKAGGGAARVTPSEAVQLMNREKASVVDVSEPAEFAAGHVPGSRNVPLAKLEGASELPKNKSLPVVVLCATGVRSGRAAAAIKKLGYERVHPLAGGLAAWREANLPVEKSSG